MFVVVFQQSAENTITFKLIPAESRLGLGATASGSGASGTGLPAGPVRESRVRLRALFDYEPKQDPNIPCQDAGLGFQKGDILHIVSQEDPFWYGGNDFIIIIASCMYCTFHTSNFFPVLFL